MDVRVRGGELAVHAGGAGGGGGRHADERGPVQAGMQAGGRAFKIMNRGKKSYPIKAS